MQQMRKKSINKRFAVYTHIQELLHVVLTKVNLQLNGNYGFNILMRSLMFYRVLYIFSIKFGCILSKSAVKHDLFLCNNHVFYL